MSYIDQSLGDGETVIARAHFSWLYAVRAWMRLLLPLAVLLMLASHAQSRPTPFAANDPYTWLIAAMALATLLGLALFIGLMVRRATTEIGVTSHRFVEKYGVFAMRTNEIALPNIEGVRVEQSFLGRIFGYGTVRIEGTGVDSVVTPPIADPVGFVRAIQTAKEHAAGRA
jgi:hypothetical protein